MSKLIIKYNDNVVEHVELRQGDMRIGRRPGCEIVIDHLAISGEHANVFTIGGDSFIQDLNSTNGTFINNKRVAKHHLRNGDTITIGQHSLVYLNEAANASPENNTIAKTVVINPMAAPSAATPAPARASTPATPTGDKRGVLVVLDGRNSGKQIDLLKSITNLGKTGRHAGVITRQGENYTLKAAADADKPKLNGRAIADDGALLRNGDIIEIAGTRLQFHLR